MELPLQCVSGPCEIRSVIRFLLAEKCTAKQIEERSKKVYGNDIPSQTLHARVERFKKNNRTHIHDEQRSGRPKEAEHEETERAVFHVLNADRRYTIDDIQVALSQEHCMKVSRSAIFRSIVEASFKKVCARWVPKLLTTELKRARVDAAEKFLAQYRGDPIILQRIVTGDETWVLYKTPSRKEDTKQWVSAGEPRPKKARLDRSQKKILCTVFWDCNGPIHIEFLDRGATINAARYCDTLDTLRSRVKRKRPGLLSQGVILLHDNAKPHDAKITQTKLSSFKWTIFQQPSNSPDLAPLGYHAFPSLKQYLGG